MGNSKRVELFMIRHLGEYIDNSFKIFKQGIGSLFKAFIIFIIPLNIVFSLLYSRIFISNFTGETSFDSYSLFLYGLYFIAVICMSMFTILVPFSFVYCYEKSSDYKTISFHNIKENVLKFFFPVLGGYLLYLVAISIVTLVFIVIVMLMAMIFQAVDFKIIVGFIIFFVSVIFFVILMYTTIPMMLFPFVKMREKDSVLKSIKRSFAIIWGEWWKTFGMLFILGIILGFIRMTFYIPFMSIYFKDIYEMTISKTTVLNLNQVLYGILIFIANISQFFNFIVSIAVSLKYYHCIEKKESVSLENEIDAL